MTIPGPPPTPPSAPSTHARTGLRRTLLVTVAVAALSLLSMGLLGGLLYYAVYPLYAPTFGDLNDWRGDDVWPATLGAGLLWSVSFLAAGLLDRRLSRAGLGRLPRWLAYFAVLWLGAALAWGAMLTTLDIRFGT